MLINKAFAQHPGRNPIKIGDEFGLNFPTLGEFTSYLALIFFSIAAMLVVFYFLIGAFELITSQGDKAHIVSARAKIYHSIIGFVLLMALFLVMQYIVPVLLGDPNTSFVIF